MFALAAHARQLFVNEIGWNAIERCIVLGGEARPVRRISATGAASLAGAFRYNGWIVRCHAVSSFLWPFPDQALAPSRPQDVAPLRISFVEVIGVDDTVGPKTPKILAQLAPGREQPHRFEIADRNRPDRAFAVTALLIAIVQRDFLALVNLRPCPHHVDAVRLSAPAGAGAARRFAHEPPP